MRGLQASWAPVRARACIKLMHDTLPCTILIANSMFVALLALLDRASRLRRASEAGPSGRASRSDNAEHHLEGNIGIRWSYHEAVRLILRELALWQRRDLGPAQHCLAGIGAHVQRANASEKCRCRIAQACVPSAPVLQPLSAAAMQPSTLLVNQPALSCCDLCFCQLRGTTSPCMAVVLSLILLMQFGRGGHAAASLHSAQYRVSHRRSSQPSTTHAGRQEDQLARPLGGQPMQPHAEQQEQQQYVERHNLLPLAELPAEAAPQYGQQPAWRRRRHQQPQHREHHPRVQQLQQGRQQQQQEQVEGEEEVDAVEEAGEQRPQQHAAVLQLLVPVPAPEPALMPVEQPAGLLDGPVEQAAQQAAISPQPEAAPAPPPTPEQQEPAHPRQSQLPVSAWGVALWTSLEVCLLYNSVTVLPR